MEAPSIRSEEALRDIIKAPPGTVTAKIRSGPLRASSKLFLASARLGVVTLVASDGSHKTFVVGGKAGFVTQGSSDGDLIVPLPAGRQPQLAEADSLPGFAGMLLMVPGVKYTLRVNGIAAISQDGDSLRLTPGQSYAHCAKAFIRSGLWNAVPASVAGPDSAVVNDGLQDQLDDAAVEFIGSSPFVAIGTSLAGSDADVSPRGDPPGFAQVVDRGQLFIPERPGNRIADTLRNLIVNPTVSLLLMLPGDPRTLEVSGEATITTDPELCVAAEINGKIPKLGILVAVRAATLRHEPAIDLSEAWNTTSHPSEADLPTIGTMVADPRQDRSMVKRALSGITDRAVEFDYKRNLY